MGEVRDQAPHATGRSKVVRVVASPWGKVVFKLLISYCHTGKMHYPSEVHPEGWCKVREIPLSFEVCERCSFNEGVKPLYLDENPYPSAKIIYVKNSEDGQ